MRRRTGWLAAWLLLVAAAGCEEDGPGGAVPAPATVDGRTVAGTGEVLAALQNAGLPCDEAVPVVLAGAVEAQRCVVDQSEDVVVLRFASPADRQAYLDAQDGLVSAVVGPNWSVRTVLRPTAERVHAAIGGELVAPAR